MIGIDLLGERPDRTCSLASLSWRAAGRSASNAGPATWPSSSTLSSAAPPAERRRQPRDRLGDVAVLGRQREGRARGDDERATARGPSSPSSSNVSPELWIERARLLAALLELPVQLGEVAVQRPSRRNTSRRSPPRRSRPPARAGEQQLQVVARVVVERRQDLVGVHVRRGVDRPGSCRPPRAAARTSSPGRARGTCPSGRCAGRSSAVASRADQVVVLGVELELHDARAVLERPPCPGRRRACRPRGSSGPGPGMTPWPSRARPSARTASRR